LHEEADQDATAVFLRRVLSVCEHLGNLGEALLALRGLGPLNEREEIYLEEFARLTRMPDMVVFFHPELAARLSPDACARLAHLEASSLSDIHEPTPWNDHLVSFGFPRIPAGNPLDSPRRNVPSLPAIPH
jgi:hypothetical protein